MAITQFRLGPTQSDWDKEIALREIETELQRLGQEVEEEIEGVTLETLLAPGAAGGIIQSDGTDWQRVDTISHSNLPSGLGSWNLGGNLTITGGTVTVDANAINWTGVSKVGSSLGDLATRSASDLSSGTLPDARFPAILPAISGQNLTNINASSVTSGNLPYAQLPTGGGTWANGGDLTLTGGDLTVSRIGTGGSPSVNFDRDNTVNTGFNFRTASVNRWNFRSSIDDAQFQITARDDAGGLLRSTIVVNRAEGTPILFTRPILYQTANTANSVLRADLPSMTAGGTLEHNFQILSNNSAGGSMTIFRASTTAANGPQLVFGKVNNTNAAVTQVTAVAVNHWLGRILWTGTDGTDAATHAAKIESVVSGAVTTSRIPAYIGFWTSAAVADDDIAEKMRLGPAGNLGLVATARMYFDGVALSGDTYITESSANVLDLLAGGTTFRATTTAWRLATNDAAALGVSGTAWSDLFLASGGVINFNAGNVTLTHAAGQLTMAGGNLLFTADNTLDIGAAGATRPRRVYVGTGLQIGTRPDYTITNPTTNRTIDVSTINAATLAQVVGTMIQDFIDREVFQ